MLDLLIFAAIAIFIFSRLFKVLGDTRYENEISAEAKEYFSHLKSELGEEAGKVAVDIEIASGTEAGLSEEQRSVFDLLRHKDKTLTADKFLGGAKTAYEMLIKAFAEKDLETLGALLSEEVYKDFAAALQNETSSQVTHENAVVSFKRCEITDATIEKDVAFISVAFETEQVKAIKDALSGEIVSGSSTKIHLVTDEWTFAKDLKSSSKMWKVVATG